MYIVCTIFLWGYTVVHRFIFTFIRSHISIKLPNLAGLNGKLWKIQYFHRDSQNNDHDTGKQVQKEQAKQVKMDNQLFHQLSR